MIRKLMASTALLALMTAGPFGLAQAQTEPAQTDQPAAVEQPADAAQPAATEDPTAAPEPAATDTAATDNEATLTPEEPTIASAFMGRSVFSSEDPESDNIGEVNDLIIGSDGMITHAVVGVGGFLGIGEKDVAVPFDELQVVEEDDGEIRLIYAATKEQLEAAEAFDRTAFDPRQRAAEEQQAEAEAGLATGAAPAPGAVIEAPADTAMTEPVETEAETEVETETDTAATTTEPAETTTVTTTEPETTTEADATTATDPAMTAGTDTTATTTEPATTGTDTAATTTTEPAATAAETDTTTTAQTDTTTTTTVPVTTTDAGAATSGEGGFVSFSADQMRASTLMGKEIYGADNESIGEVSDLVLQEDGSTRAAIVDVGGFLGVGEKSVAIPFDQLTMAPSEGEDGQRVTVAMTREQLEQAPAFEGIGEEAEQTAAVDPAQPAGTDPAVTDPNAPAGTATTDPNVAAEQTAAAQFEPVTQDLTADDLIGSAVIGSNEENLGEVNDVVFDPNGGIQAVVVDVGGFLGIGEKPVAVQFDSLNVQKNGNDDFRLMINATQEQLENAPTYDEEAAEAGQPQPTVQ